MSAGSAAHYRRRLMVRPAVILAAWLIALQGFLAGLATAQAGALLASPSAETAVICHAAGGASPAGDTTDKAKQALHLCCACCTAAVAAPAAPGGAISQRRSVAAAVAARAFTLVAARGLIRAGPSQGPPTLA